MEGEATARITTGENSLDVHEKQEVGALGVILAILEQRDVIARHLEPLPSSVDQSVAERRMGLGARGLDQFWNGVTNRDEIPDQVVELAVLVPPKEEAMPHNNVEPKRSCAARFDVIANPLERPVRGADPKPRGRGHALE